MKTVLFADDNKMLREICKRIFEEEGYRVLLAQNGMEAIEMVKADRPDVVILDIHMSPTGGMAAAEQINGIDANIPIIFYTANDDTCARDNRSRFASACVDKSSDSTELAIAVARLLSLRKQGAAHRFGLSPIL